MLISGPSAAMYHAMRDGATAFSLVCCLAGPPSASLPSLCAVNFNESIASALTFLRDLNELRASCFSDSVPLLATLVCSSQPRVRLG